MTEKTVNMMRNRVKPAIILSARDYDRLSTLAQAARNRLPYLASERAEEVGRAHVLGRDEIADHFVGMNDDVEFRDDTTGRVRQITLVYPDEADIAKGKISVMTRSEQPSLACGSDTRSRGRRPMERRGNLLCSRFASLICTDQTPGRATSKFVARKRYMNCLALLALPAVTSHGPFELRYLPIGERWGDLIEFGVERRTVILLRSPLAVHHSAEAPSDSPIKAAPSGLNTETAFACVDVSSGRTRTICLFVPAMLSRTSTHELTATTFVGS